jgi:hypothetical protein
VKRRGGGKAKGSAFEREICKALSLYVTQGEMDDVFWRSAMSGGRATVSAAKSKLLSHVSGDLCATHPRGYGFIEKYYVECKYYKDLQYKTLVTSNVGLIAHFWEVAQMEAIANNKEPVLILKQNQMPTLVGMRRWRANMAIVKALPFATFPRLDLDLFNFGELFYYEAKATPHKQPASKAVRAKKQPHHVRPALNVKPKRRV